jgi:hypothetical protein
LKQEKPTSVSDLLGKGHGLLERLRQGSAKADETLQAVRGVLPDGLGEHVWGATVRDRTLTVLVASAAWATRIRYHAPDLKDEAAARLGIEIDRVLVRARPAGATPAR